MNSVKKIEIEHVRIRGQLEKNNNPSTALYISLLAVLFSFLYNFAFETIKTTLNALITVLKIENLDINLIANVICFVSFLFFVQNMSSKIGALYRNDIQFYITALDVLEDMKKKNLEKESIKKGDNKEIFITFFFYTLKFNCI
ncbi:TPA: hypothetical protein ACKONR_003957 [Clostridioides difficile]|nr:hypothetical protein [Clostridioides difficile]MCG7702435.1 hypothetical protein [Clostridioides difficile]MCP8398780.1 hypothetical protein [Clostridioides difficile]MCP8411874.1 hypothetical protein [Clostridioides difficile]MCP8414576.1 hypothetical protein [Clostridioides difficile]MCP8495166.1 hypothetical protein [Clostridioides difficile]